MALRRQTVIALSRGTDVRFTLAFADEAGNAVDMTGHTIAVFEADAAWGEDNFTVAWTDQAGGVALLTGDWTDPEEPPDEVWVIVRTTRTSDGYDQAAPKITVRWIE